MADVKFQPTPEDAAKLRTTLFLMTESGRASLVKLYKSGASNLKPQENEDKRKGAKKDVTAIDLVVTDPETNETIHASEGHHLQTFVSQEDIFPSYGTTRTKPNFKNFATQGGGTALPENEQGKERQTNKIESKFDELVECSFFSKYELFHKFLEFCLKKRRPLRTFYKGEELPNKRDDEKIYNREKHKTYTADLGRRLDEAKNADPITLPNPYKGLSHFSREDHELFFGRDQQITELCKKVRNQVFTAIIGQSGCGKSSLAFAGVVHKLCDQGDYILLDIDLDASPKPFGLLLEALIKLYPEKGGLLIPKLQEDTLDFAQAVRLVSTEQEDKKYLIVIDQFEKILRPNVNKESRLQFLAMLVDVVEKDEGESKLSFVITFRYDFIHQINQSDDISNAFYKLLENRDYGYKVYPIRNEAPLREIIKNPLMLADYKKTNIHIEDELVDAIIRDASSTGYNLSLIEFTLSRLWDERGKRSMDNEDGYVLTLHAYENMGRLSGALPIHATEQLDTLTDKEKQYAETLFIKLVQLNEGLANTKKRVIRNELKDEEWVLAQKLASVKKVNSHEGKTITVQRLIALNQDPPSVEIIHDTLIQEWEVLKEWLSQYSPFLKWREEFKTYFKHWLEESNNPEHYLRGIPLSIAADWMQDNKALMLLDDEKQFIEESIQNKENRDKAEVDRRKEENRRKVETIKRQKRSLRLLIFAVTAFGLLTLFAFIKWYDSEINSKRLKAELSSQHIKSGENRFAILRALDALDRTVNKLNTEDRYYKKAVNTLKKASGEFTQVIRFSVDKTVASFDISSDMKLVSLGYENGVFEIRNIRDNNLILSDKLTDEPIMSIQFTTKNKLTLLTSEKIFIYDVDEKALIHIINVSNVEHVNYTHDLKYYAINSYDGVSEVGYLDDDNINSIPFFKTDKDVGRIQHNYKVVIDPNGKWFLHIQKGSVTQYEISDGDRDSGTIFKDKYNSDFLISPDSKKITALGSDDRYRLGLVSDFINQIELQEISFNFTENRKNSDIDLNQGVRPKERKLSKKEGKENYQHIEKLQIEILEELEESIQEELHTPPTYATYGLNNKNLRIWHPLSSNSHFFDSKTAKYINSFEPSTIFDQDILHLFFGLHGDNWILSTDHIIPNFKVIDIYSGSSQANIGLSHHLDDPRKFPKFKGNEDFIYFLDYDQKSEAEPNNFDIVIYKKINVPYSQVTLSGYNVAPPKHHNVESVYHSSTQHVQFSQDASYIATSTYDGEVRVWRTDNGTLVKNFKGNAKKITSLAFIGMNTKLITASEDGNVRFWDIESGRELYELDIPHSAIQHISLSKDHQSILSFHAHNYIVFAFDSADSIFYYKDIEDYTSLSEPLLLEENSTDKICGDIFSDFELSSMISSKFLNRVLDYCEKPKLEITYKHRYTVNYTARKTYYNDLVFLPELEEETNKSNDLNLEVFGHPSPIFLEVVNVNNGRVVDAINEILKFDDEIEEKDIYIERFWFGDDHKFFITELDSKIYKIDLHTGKVVSDFDLSTNEHQDKIQAFGNFLTTSSKSTIKIIDMITEEPVFAIDIGDDIIEHYDIAPKQKKIAIALKSGKVIIRNLELYSDAQLIKDYRNLGITKFTEEEKSRLN